MVDRNEIFVLYVLIYMIVSFCYVFRSNEFISAGLTIESMFQQLLGQESDNFVYHHMKRISLTLLIHSFLPLGFMLGLNLLNIYQNFTDLVGEIIALPCYFISATLFSVALLIVAYWYIFNWINHPVVKNILPFCSYNNWNEVAQEINSEFKRLEKLILQCGPRTKLITTENWIISMSAYSLKFAHQDDSELLVCREDTYNIARIGYTTDDFRDSINSSSIIQFLDIKVNCTRNISSFFVRINALDFKDLKDSLRCQVTVPTNVMFYQTKIEMFLELFRQHVSSNPVYYETNEPDTCCGCLNESSNVKLIKNCDDDDDVVEIRDEIMIPNCYSCKCRPMWCLDCMGKWFASRQNQRNTSNWLSSKCTCPVCRSVFCILDVSPVRFVSEENAQGER